MLMVMAVGAGFYLVAALFVYFGQKGMLYYPQRALEMRPDMVGLSYVDINLETHDGVAIHGWYVTAPNPRGAALFLHGNAGNLSNRVPLIQLLNSLALDVCIIDYRGYGKSDGEPTEEGTYADARAAWEYLLFERGLAPEQIVLFGRSLGAAVAAQLAASVNPAPAGVILEGCFTSVPDMGAEIYPWLPVRLLARYDYNTRAAVREFNAPLLVLHSSDDQVTPLSQGRAVFDAANEPKRFVELLGGHDDAYIVSETEYTNALREFLDGTLPGATKGTE